MLEGRDGGLVVAELHLRASKIVVSIGYGRILLQGRFDKRYRFFRSAALYLEGSQFVSRRDVVGIDFQFGPILHVGRLDLSRISIFGAQLFMQSGLLGSEF